MKIVAPTAEGICIAAEAIRAGEVVAYPTETVYGLGVDPFSEAALARLIEVKGRDPNKPFLLIAADMDQVARVACDISLRAQVYAAAFWPGPLSLLLPKAPGSAHAVAGDSGKVCVRIPACDTARELCRMVGGAVTSTSANPAGGPPARHLAEIVLAGVAVGIDGGVLAPSPPSTVYDPDLDIIVREGAISRQQLAKDEVQP